jgi:serine/threonine-protein kinase
LSIPDPLLGRQLGNYLIQAPLGQGGMARVYKGLDIALKRPVAIKVIGEGFRQSEFYAQRFEREAQAVANLRHQNIVSVFYFGNQDNLYYLVMEFIDGTDLEAVLRNYANNRELMPYADVMRILEAIASALDYAHEHDVIHRDVKPSNILVERSGRPVLTDFGLALRVSEGTVGNTFGTPHYISPEQAQNSGNVVPQSDLYSLAVVAYEMLAGTVPFDDPSPTALAMQHIMASAPSPRAFNPKLSEEVEQVLFKGLAKEPNDRYATGAEFVNHLRPSLEAMLRSPRALPLQVAPDGVGEDEASRHLSMQTVLDKVHQELAILHAKGQTVTQLPDTNTLVPKPPSRVSNLIPYIVTTSVAVVVLLIVAAVSLLSPNAPSATPTAADLITQVIDSPTVALVTDTIIPQPTANITQVPTSEPTNTQVLENIVVAAVSPTALAPTQTSLPVTLESLLSTEIPTPLPVVVQTGSTPVPSDWLPVRFIYTNDAFYWMNDASRSINSRPIVFERIGGTGRFEGQRWAFWTMEPGRCMEIIFTDVSSPQRPDGCRPNAFFTPTRNQDTNFWTGSGNFRVLWNGTEIALCDIAAGVCNAAVPPA